MRASAKGRAARAAQSVAIVIPAKAGIHLMKEGSYIISASQKGGTLYEGSTSKLVKRIYEHDSGPTMV
jgi:hypothetical protein